MSELTDWPRARPDVGGGVLAHWVLTSATELTGARRDLVTLVADLGGPDGARGSLRVPDVLALLLSELVTNALRHAVPPAEVTVRQDGSTCLLDVADHDPQSPPTPEHDRSPGLGGHGLPLVAMLATDRGWYVEDGRKHVWACLKA
ncbi:ATP-binding protein [Pseudokineococcus basanitobsidens]|uniref:ATP-binding protein n=1 Tax=Pseudokineococcus basanitobsidens TaxID=1926649 RepID=A0ABU8RFQ1_9ACTN